VDLSDGKIKEVKYEGKKTDKSCIVKESINERDFIFYRQGENFVRYYLDKMIELRDKKGIISNETKLPDFKDLEQITLFFNDYDMDLKGQKVLIVVKKNGIYLEKSKMTLSYGRIKGIMILLDKWNQPE
jgi:hypothetical protein